MKKSRLPAALLAAVLMLSLITPLASFALDDPAIAYTEHCYVCNIENDTAMFEKGANDRVAPAGTVKIMTALLALEHYGADLTQTVTVSAAAVENIQGNACKLSEGETLTAGDLLAALIIGNYNDAALALAYDIAGDVTAFVDAMNARAAELGMENTYYLNPTGIDASGMYTSAADVARVAKEASALPAYIKLSDSPSYTIEATNKSAARTFYNRNYFVSTYYNLNYFVDSVIGLNSGMTNAAGCCVCAVARNDDGLTYIVVVMGALEPAELEDDTVVTAYEDAATLIAWAYKGFKSFTVVDTADMICEVPVRLSAGIDHVILLPENKLTSFLPVDCDIENEVELRWTLTEKELTAPVTEGAVVGSLSAYMNDELLGTVNLVSKSGAERSEWLLLLDTAGKVLKNPFVIALIVVLLVAFAAVIVLISVYISRRQRRVRYRKK